MVIGDQAFTRHYSGSTGQDRLPLRKAVWSALLSLVSTNRTLSGILAEKFDVSVETVDLIRSKIEGANAEIVKYGEEILRPVRRNPNRYRDVTLLGDVLVSLTEVERCVQNRYLALLREQIPKQERRQLLLWAAREWRDSSGTTEIDMRKFLMMENALEVTLDRVCQNHESDLE